MTKRAPRRATTLAATLLVITPAVTGNRRCSAGDTTTAADEPTPLTVGLLPIADVAPIYVGVERGFADEGIDLERARTDDRLTRHPLKRSFEASSIDHERSDRCRP